jgi:uncharacterized protein DUF3800
VQMPLKGFPFLPKFDDEGTVILASLYAYFDESGTAREHEIVSFSGLVDSFQTWLAFGNEWARLLREYKLTEFHAGPALRHSQPYGTMKPGTAEERSKDVLPFVTLICERIELGIVSAVKVSDYKAAHQRLRESFGTDPIYFAFHHAVMGILNHWVSTPQYDVGLILDDEEAKAVECYRLLKKMKLANPEVRRRVTSICFTDDKTSVQDQSADLFCYLSRIDNERVFLGKPHPFDALCEPLRFKYPGRRLTTAGGLFEKDYLARFIESAMKLEREAKKAKGTSK